MKFKHKHIAFFISALVATVVVGGFYIYMYQTVGASAARAVLARSIVAAQVSNKADEKNTVEIYDATASDRARLRSFFISSDAAVSFIESLEGLGAQAGSDISLSNVTAEDVSASKPGSFGHIQAHVEATGSWSAVMKTLKLSEILPYQSMVSNVRFEQGGLSTGKTPRIVWRLTYDVVADTLVNAVSSATSSAASKP